MFALESQMHLKCKWRKLCVISLRSGVRCCFFACFLCVFFHSFFSTSLFYIRSLPQHWFGFKWIMQSINQCRQVKVKSVKQNWNVKKDHDHELCCAFGCEKWNYLESWGNLKAMLKVFFFWCYWKLVVKI